MSKKLKMNINREKLDVPVCLFAVFVLWISGSAGTFIPNLTDRCYRCLCYVSTKCDLSLGCTDGYCGPFSISRAYWAEAGKIVLPEDEPERNNAWKDCARNYNCAKRIIEGYLLKFGRDCNDDGVTNCYDYMLVNANGGYGCAAPLDERNAMSWLQRYAECDL